MIGTALAVVAAQAPRNPLEAAIVFEIVTLNHRWSSALAMAAQSGHDLKAQLRHRAHAIRLSRQARAARRRLLRWQEARATVVDPPPATWAYDLDALEAIYRAGPDGQVEVAPAAMPASAVAATPAVAAPARPSAVVLAFPLGPTIH